MDAKTTKGGSKMKVAKIVEQTREYKRLGRSINRQRSLHMESLQFISLELLP